MLYMFQEAPRKLWRLRLYRPFKLLDLLLKMVLKRERVFYLYKLQVRLDVIWVIKITISHLVAISNSIPLYCQGNLEGIDRARQYIWILILWYQEPPKKLLKRKKSRNKLWIVAFSFLNYQPIRNLHCQWARDIKQLMNLEVPLMVIISSSNFWLMLMKKL